MEIDRFYIVKLCVIIQQDAKKRRVLYETILWDYIID
jgi:hypothetical protein